VDIETAATPNPTTKPTHMPGAPKPKWKAATHETGKATTQ
jgi:hypothetical protein